MSIESGIKNYYEDKVVNEIVRQSEALGISKDEFDDVACVALNKLPPRYCRHSVDISFYLSETEAAEIHDKVTTAVADAAAYVKAALGKKAQRAG